MAHLDMGILIYVEFRCGALMLILVGLQLSIHKLAIQAMLSTDISTAQLTPIRSR